LRAWERQHSRVTFASIFRLDSRQRPVGRVAWQTPILRATRFGGILSWQRRHRAISARWIL